MSKPVQFVEIYNVNAVGTIKDYAVRTVYLNPDHVVCLREDSRAERLLHEGHLPKDLDVRQQFTAVTLNKGTYGQEITVVGLISDVHQKLFRDNRVLLRG